MMIYSLSQPTFQNIKALNAGNMLSHPKINRIFRAQYAPSYC